MTQIYRPGTPVIGGIFATPFSMQFMGPIFGTPESHLAQLAGCQLVRRLGVPCRGDGLVKSSKINDAQAGYEPFGLCLQLSRKGATGTGRSAACNRFAHLRMGCETPLKDDGD
ncbi:MULTISPECIES: trimethylamine methyltransferase family protein [unclassified Phaeobacter]|uniref:trimethylamine methyltransferase family protein n=1 Tax=unclassified Phaeobacter TaxID=2621772 RepID=UPI003A8B183C